MEMLREELRELGSGAAGVGVGGGAEEEAGAAGASLGDGEAESALQGAGTNEEEDDEGDDLGEAAAHRMYVRRVSAFVAMHEAACKRLPALEEGLADELKALCAYFDEAYDPKEPTR